MEEHTLRRISLEEIPAPEARFSDPEVDAVAMRAIREIREGGERSLREWAVRYDGLEENAPLVLSRDAMKKAWDGLVPAQAELLERAAGRIAAFASAQLGCLAPLAAAVPGGRAGHEFVPAARAGCYVPGGAFPLPSSALMTIIPAKVAGVPEVWAAGPRPSAVTLAAAWRAGADGFLQCGGAHAIAALAFGIAVPPCDVVTGPGGKFVASAKRLLFGLIGTEAPAGPSELLIIGDDSADPAIMAADLLAQAEHSPDAVPCLIASSEALASAVEREIEAQLEALPEPNRSIARRSLANGWCCIEAHFEHQVSAADRFAPEHLELAVSDPEPYRKAVRNAGAVFAGMGAAEVFGDYGAGPNHTLPTGGAARFAGGLSVLQYLKVRTWLSVDDPVLLAADTAAFARLEGLEAHARAAELRCRPVSPGSTYQKP